MPQRNYLIIGATGKTGVHTIRHLLKDGHAVRAFVHQEDERSAALRNEGAEVVVGDLLEHDDVKTASGNNKLQGRAKKTADEMAEQLRIRFQEQGWIN